jgi:hypothetical protein
MAAVAAPRQHGCGGFAGENPHVPSDRVSTALDPRENPLTEVRAAVLEHVEGLADVLGAISLVRESRMLRGAGSMGRR